MKDILRGNDEDEDPIETFQQRYQRSYVKRKPAVKKAVVKGSTESENDIKLHWKTLMCFCKREWKSKRYPLPKKIVDADDRDFYYIGRSDIEKKKIYFSVSEHIIPEDRDSYVFSNSFFRHMTNNKEYEIPQESKEKLFRMVQTAVRSTIDAIVPIMVEEVKMWKCKHQGGYFSKPQTHEWVKETFEKDFEETYDMLMDDANLNKAITCPSGKRNETNDEDKQHEIIPAHIIGRGKTKYSFGDNAYCAFGNRANGLHLLNDDKAASFFFANRFKTVSSLVADYTTLDITKTNINEFVTAIRIVRERFGYVTKALDMSHQPWKTNDEDRTVLKYVEIQGYETAITHVVCIYRGYIYDGAIGKTLKLSRESMEYICGHQNFVMKCYAIEQSLKIKKALEKRREDKKRKST